MKGRALLIVLALAVPQTAAGQVASRVSQVEDGTVRFEYDTKPEVEICEQGIRIGDRHMWWNFRGADDRPSGCRFGTAELELSVRDGVVRGVELLRSDDERTVGAVELGRYRGQEAAEYLLALVRDGATRRAAEDVMMPAMIADADDVWRDLLDIAKEPSVDEDVRKQALFWLSQEAAEAATQGLSEVALDRDEDQEIRDAAIFALSQRPRDEGVPILMELARDGDQAETRRKAMFWLAQTDDDRVIDFFESILLGRGR